MTAPSSAPASIHFFSNNPTTSDDIFGVLWYLVDFDKPPKISEASIPPWQGIVEGDLVVFPALLSGAGEFESVRIVGQKTTNILDDQEEVLPLFTAGIEYPEFPSLVLSMSQKLGITLRDRYEIPFNALLESQNLALKDLLGGDDAYQEFWNEPPVARRRRPPEENPWRISLAECDWIKTFDGTSLLDTTKKMGDKDHEL